MSSKFIKNSRISRAPKYTQTVDNSKEMWYSFASPDNSKEQEENRVYKERQQKKKDRVEAIPLDTLSFRDLYEFPFHQAKYGSWVYDANGNFIFQFENGGATMREKVVSILNGEISEYSRREVRGSEGSIEVNLEGNWKDLILIRGWGNLTGVGAHNLDCDYAAKIQDTLQEYILEKLSN
jgi:hypothetical protein